MGMMFKVYFMQDKDKAVLIKNKGLVNSAPEISGYAKELRVADHFHKAKVRDQWFRYKELIDVLKIKHLQQSPKH